MTDNENRAAVDAAIAAAAVSLVSAAVAAATEAGYTGETPQTMRAPPGKFESEPFYVPYYYGLMLDGAESVTFYDADKPIAVFDVDASDRAAFGFDPETTAVALWETDTGFAMFAEWTQEQYDEAESADSSDFEDYCQW